MNMEIAHSVLKCLRRLEMALSLASLSRLRLVWLLWLAPTFASLQNYTQCTGTKLFALSQLQMTAVLDISTERQRERDFVSKQHSKLYL
jgi:hypothetical protein